MLNKLKKIKAQYILLRNGYCIKHQIYRYGFLVGCSQCDREKQQKIKSRVDQAKAVLNNGD